MISGCSGGGKSSLLDELARRGFATVAEPGRRIVREEQRAGGTALPWIDSAAFARRAIVVARADRIAAEVLAGWVFFDRGLIDAAAALEVATGVALRSMLGAAERNHRQMFMAPPWRAIYRADAERRHGFDDAVAEYHRLCAAYAGLGYTVTTLPFGDVATRADFVLDWLARDAGPPNDPMR